MLFIVKTIDLETSKESKIFILKSSYEDLLNYLDNNKITFLSILKLPNFIEFFYKNVTLSKVTNSDIIFLFETLSSSMDMGISLLDSLHDISYEVENKTFKNILLDIIESLEHGISFVDACKKHPKVFKKDILTVLEIGQESGKFTQTLNDIALTLSNKEKLSSSIKQSMIYPSIALVVILAVFSFWGIYIIPKIINNFSGNNMQLPAITIAVGDFFFYVKQNWELLSSILSLLVLVFILSFKKCQICKEKIAYFFSKLPFISTMVQEYNIVLISRYISLILTAGKPLSYAIETLQKSVSNPMYKNKLHTILQELLNGKQFSETIKDSKLFTRVFYRAVIAGELNGSLDKELHKISDTYTQKLYDKAKAIPKIIEPLVTLMLGALIILLIFSVLAPIYDLIIKI